MRECGVSTSAVRGRSAVVVRSQSAILREVADNEDEPLPMRPTEANERTVVLLLVFLFK